MSEQFPVESEWVANFRKRMARSMPASRIVLSRLDGTHRVKEMSEALNSTGLTASLSSAEVTVRNVVARINLVAQDELGEPLIIKNSRISPLLVNEHTGAAYMDLIDAFMPRVIGAEYPRVLSEDAEKDEYIKSVISDTNKKLVELTESGSGGIGLLPLFGPYIDMTTNFEGPTMKFTKKELSKIDSSTPTSRQLDQMNTTIGTWLGRAVYSKEVEWRAGSTGKGVKTTINIFDVEALKLVDERVKELGELGERDITPEDVKLLDESLGLVNSYIAGGSKDIPLIGNLSIRSATVLLVMLERHSKSFTRQEVIQRAGVLIGLVKDYLSFWGLGSGSRTVKGSPKISKFLSVLADADLKKPTNAECSGMDPDLFFPERGASTKESKTICGCCPALEDCLMLGLVGGEKFGIWGGTSERERRIFRKKKLLEQGPSEFQGVVEGVRLKAEKELGGRSLPHYIAAKRLKTLGATGLTDQAESDSTNGDAEFCVAGLADGTPVLPFITVLLRASGEEFARKDVINAASAGNAEVLKVRVSKFKSHMEEISARINGTLGFEAIRHNGLEKSKSGYLVAELTSDQMKQVLSLFT